MNNSGIIKISKESLIEHNDIYIEAFYQFKILVLLADSVGNSVVYKCISPHFDLACDGEIIEYKIELKKGGGMNGVFFKFYLKKVATV